MKRWLLLAAAVALCGCSGGASVTSGGRSAAAVSVTAGSTVTPSIAPLSSVAPTPSAAPSPTAIASVRVDPTGQPSPPVERCESQWAVTTADTLRVRTQPNVGDESIKRDPLLGPGTEVNIIDGPVAGSGYWWYEVLLRPGILRDDVTEGWIAAGDRDGTPWIICMGID